MNRPMLAIMLGAGVSLAACGKKSSSSPSTTPGTTASTGGGATGGAAASTLSLPLVTPPVKAATPAGLRKGASLALDGGSSPLSAGDITSRFFTDGPTYIFGILGNIDGFITGINAGKPTCVFGDANNNGAQTPVPYPVDAFGQTETFYAQCYTQDTPTADDPQLRMVGLSPDGTTLFLYAAYAAERVAATVAPADGSKITAATASTKLTVRAWLGVGYTNVGACPDKNGTWDSCSYGVIQIYAQASAADLDATAAAAATGTATGTATSIATASGGTLGFEMSVAGLGFGYCGAQMISDGVDIYFEGSNDMGLTCGDDATLCVAAADLSTVAGTCSVTTFGANTAALGRMSTTGTKQTFGASGYPAVPTIVLNGTTTDALWFGPTAPPTGVPLMSGVVAGQPPAGGATGTTTSANTGS